MGIPLAALGINQQPGPLETVGKALQLKSLQQNQQYQAQAQPLELQQQQNQVEMQKRQMADMDAATKAMNDWKTGDLADLPDLVRKHGGSFNAVMAAHKQVYDQKEQAAKIAEQDATTGSKLVETYQKKADQVSGELSAAKDIPDEQLHDWATGKVTELAQSGLIDAPHAQQMLQALQQTQNPAMIRQGLDHYSKSILGASALAKQAKESQDLKTAQATQKHLEMETAAGVKPTEASLAERAAKGDPDAIKAIGILDKSKRESRPIIGAIPGPALSDTAKDQAAEKYWQTGQLPPGNRGAAGMIQNRGIMNRAAELHPTGSLAANSAEYKANSAALTKVQTQSDMVEAFENTAIKNLDQILKAAEAIPDVGVKFANTPIRAFDSKVIGTENMARLNAAMVTGRTETARVLASANAAGVLTNEQRGEVEQILGANFTYPAMKAAINQLKVDMGNRKQSYRDQIADIKGRLGGGSAAPASAPAPGGYQPLPSFKEWDAQRKAQAKP